MYGIEVTHNDPIVEVAERALDAMVQAATPGNFLVDMIPWRMTPSSFPILTNDID